MRYCASCGCSESDHHGGKEPLLCACCDEGTFEPGGKPPDETTTQKARKAMSKVGEALIVRDEAWKELYKELKTLKSEWLAGKANGNKVIAGMDKESIALGMQYVDTALKAKIVMSGRTKVVKAMVKAKGKKAGKVAGKAKKATTSKATSEPVVE